jgi:hypothetical protein
MALKELRYYSHFYGNSVMIPFIPSEKRWKYACRIVGNCGGSSSGSSSFIVQKNTESPLDWQTYTTSFVACFSLMAIPMLRGKRLASRSYFVI